MKYLTILLLLFTSTCEAAVTQFWKLNDNAASTTIVATTGTNGTLSGGDNTSVKTTDGPAPGNYVIIKGLDFNGTDDAIDISASAISFASGAAFSASFWVEMDAATGRWLARADGFGGSITKLNDTTIRCNFGAGGHDFTVAAMGTTAWRHVLVTRTTGNSLRCFVNGTESSTGAIAGVTSTFNPTHIGAQSTFFNDGKMAYVRIYDSDEAANVAAIYAEGLSTLTRWWRLNENAASTLITDSVIGGENGVYSGANTVDRQTSAGPGGSIAWALDFDGTDDYITSINFPNAASGTAWTVSCWVELDGADDTTCVLWGRLANNTSYCYIPSVGTLRVAQTSTISDFTIPTLGTTAWHHIFITKNTSDLIRVWVDGTESSTGGLTNTSTNAPTELATANTGANDHNGKITMFRTWSTDESANVAYWRAEGVTAGSGAKGAFYYYQFGNLMLRKNNHLRIASDNAWSIAP